MKRRNVDCVKPRRPLKRTKIGEGNYGSTFVYLKFLVVWMLVIAADFLFDFRFEYLWPFWLLLRSVYDSFRYQGIAFSILFVCMALTSDMICLLFIPVNWLFFAASTYVWVQFIWHTEKGVCMPSVVLWVLFIYIEAMVRLKDVKSAAFHLDLCRPFAAHCIGYPVVTLGFGLKSYVGYRLRQRRQREVAKENEFYIQLLQKALPPELQQSSSPDKSSKEICEDVTINGDIEIQATVSQNGTTSAGTHNLSNCNGSITTGSNHSSGSSRSRGSKNGADTKVDDHYHQKEDISPPPSKSDHKHRLHNGSLHMELEYMQKKGWPSSKSVNDYDESEADKDKSIKSLSSSQCSSNSSSSHASSSISNGGDSEKKKSNSNSSQSNNSSKLPGSHTNNLKDSTIGSSRDRKNKNKDNNKDASQMSKEETVSIIRLESDSKRLKADLQCSRQSEQELRNQINNLISADKITQQEMNQLQQDNDNLQNKLHNLVTTKQNDRSTINTLERRLQEERRTRQNSENQISQLERRNKKLEEQNQARAQALANAKGECSESCRSRRGEIENEVKRLRREIRSNEERFRNLEREILTLRQYKETQGEAEVLMSALSAMQDKNTHLESSLSAETKVKLDLFSALGEAKRQLEIRESQILGKEKEIEDLKTKFTEVLAVCPRTSFSGNCIDSSRFQYSSKILPQVSQDGSSSIMLGDAMIESIVGLSFRPPLTPQSLSPPLPSNLHHSNLDPNARVYTPKCGPGSDS